MPFELSLNTLAKSDAIKTQKVCGFYDNIDEDSEPKIMYCGKIQDYDAKYVKLDSGIFIRRDFVLDSQITQKNNYNQVELSFKVETDYDGDDYEPEYVDRKLQDMTPFDQMYFSDAPDKKINLYDVNQFNGMLSALSPLTFPVLRKQKQEVCGFDEMSMIGQKLSHNMRELQQYKNDPNYKMNEFHPRYHFYCSTIEAENSKNGYISLKNYNQKHKSGFDPLWLYKKEDVQHAQIQHPNIIIHDLIPFPQDYQLNKTKPYTLYQLAKKSKHSQLKEKACAITPVRTPEGNIEYQPNCEYFRTWSFHDKDLILYPITLLDEKAFRYTLPDRSIITIDMTQYKDRFVRNESGKKYDKTCKILLPFEQVKNADIDSIMRSAIEHTEKTGKEVGFAMNDKQRLLTPVIEGCTNQIADPSSSVFRIKTAKRIIAFHTHPECSKFPSVADIRNGLKNNLYKDFIGTKCGDDYNVTEISYPKLRKQEILYKEIQEYVNKTTKKFAGFTDQHLVDMFDKKIMIPYDYNYMKQYDILF